MKIENRGRGSTMPISLLIRKKFAQVGFPLLFLYFHLINNCFSDDPLFTFETKAFEFGHGIQFTPNGVHLKGLAGFPIKSAIQSFHPGRMQKVFNYFDPKGTEEVNFFGLPKKFIHSFHVFSPRFKSFDF